MNKTTHILLTLILVLLAINLAMTTKLLMDKPASATTEKATPLAADIAKDWGKQVVELYNQQDHQAMYALFNEQAKVKISHEQLQEQLQKLHGLFGNIEEHALANSVKLGEKGEEQYYQLSFSVRVSGPNVDHGTLTLSLITRDNVVSLYGMRLNAAQSLD